MDEPKEKEVPKCNLKWEEDHFIVECETAEDRERAIKALEEEDIVVRVRPKRETEKENS
jgi:hypothetical protein